MNVLALAAENFVWLASALALLAFSVSAVVRWLTVTEHLTASPHALAALYATAVAAPPLAAAWVVLAALLPLVSFGEAFPQAHAWATHEDHLLSGLLEPLQPAAQRAAGAAFIVLITGAIVAIVTAAVQARRALHVLGVVQQRSAGSTRGRHRGILRARTQFPVCFLWGVRRPRIVISEGLVASLRPRELRAVLEHEAAHASRHDNLAKVVLSICAHATLLWPLTRRVLRWHAEQAELICDESAAARTRAPLALADALIAVHRRARAAIVPYTAALVSSRTGLLEHRVSRLLAFADASTHPPAHSRTSFGVSALTVAGLFAVSLAVISLIAPLGVHAVAELLLHRLP
jgi:Zn-dependent protease with chaperone function